MLRSSHMLHNMFKCCIIIIPEYISLKNHQIIGYITIPTKLKLILTFHNKANILMIIATSLPSRQWIITGHHCVYRDTVLNIWGYTQCVKQGQIFMDVNVIVSKDYSAYNCCIEHTVYHTLHVPSHIFHIRTGLSKLTIWITLIKHLIHCSFTMIDGCQARFTLEGMALKQLLVDGHINGCSQIGWFLWGRIVGNITSSTFKGSSDQRDSIL